MEPERTTSVRSGLHDSSLLGVQIGRSGARPIFGAMCRVDTPGALDYM
jgi:hypothetical protein